MNDDQEVDDMTTPPRAALGRGLLILLVAVIVGIVILNSLDHTKSTSATKTTPTTKASKSVVDSTTTSTTIALRSPADIKVLVANGSSTSGVGKTASDLLTASKYAAIPAVTATTPSTTTSIYFADGYQKEAALIATVMNLSTVVPQPMPTSLPVASLGGANILIVIGNDQAASFAPKTTSTVAHSTATTAKATTSTTK